MPNTNKKQQSQADILVDLAIKKAEFFHDQYHEPWARIKVENHYEVLLCKGKNMKRWLSMIYYYKLGKVPNSESLRAALNTLSAKAIFEGKKHELFNRSAFINGRIYYDLNDKEKRIVEVAQGDWNIKDSGDAIFRRYTHQQEQASPVDDNKFKWVELFDLLNIKEKNWLLYAVWLCLAFIANIAHAILIIYGPPGAAKSWCSKLTRWIIDPSATYLLRMPKNQRELVQMLFHHWAAFFDNLSSLPDWISDDLCMAVTGGGFSKKELYTDDDDIIYQFRRVVLLNGINVAAVKPDLLDRSILIELNEIDDDQRKSEENMLAEFERIKPMLLGAIFNTLSKALQNIDNYKLTELPRLADFARWGYAIAEALPPMTALVPESQGEAFLRNYKANISLQRKEAIAASPVANTIIEFMKNQEEWTGTPSELLLLLRIKAQGQSISTRSSSWPKAPNALSKQLNEIKLNLKNVGIQVERPPRGDARCITLSKVKEKTDGCDGTVGKPFAEDHNEETSKSDKEPADEVIPCAICGSTDESVVHPYGEEDDLICDHCFAAEEREVLMEEYYSKTIH